MLNIPKIDDTNKITPPTHKIEKYHPVINILIVVGSLIVYCKPIIIKNIPNIRLIIFTKLKYLIKSYLFLWLNFRIYKLKGYTLN